MRVLTCGGDIGAAGGGGSGAVAAGEVGAGLPALLQHLLAEGASLVWEEEVRVQTRFRGTGRRDTRLPRGPRACCFSSWGRQNSGDRGSALALWGEAEMGQDKLRNDGEEEFSPKGPRVSWKAMLSFSSSSMIQLSSSGKLEAIRKGGRVRAQAGVPVPSPLGASFSVCAHWPRAPGPSHSHAGLSSGYGPVPRPASLTGGRQGQEAGLPLQSWAPCGTSGPDSLRSHSWE